MRLQGARAVVTGGASGLGLAVAERLVEVGARVVVLDLRPPIALPPGAAYVEADVGSEAAADRAMAEAVDVLGGLTLAVCCAGISHRGRVVGREGPMAHMDFARVVTVNLIGTFLVCRAAATVMQHNDPEPDGERGVIVNTASIAAFDGQIGQGRLCRLQRRGGEPDLAAGPRIRKLRGKGRLHCPGGLRDPDGGVPHGDRAGGAAPPSAVSQTPRGPRGVCGTLLPHLRKPHAERRGDPARWGLEDGCEIAHDPTTMTQPP